MGLAAMAFLVGAAELPWMSLVTVAVIKGLAFPVFGAQATLWDLGGSASPVALDPTVPLAAGTLLVFAGVLAVVRTRWSAAVASAALALFLYGTWGVFGAHAVGPAWTVIALGPGVPWAVAGIAAGAVAYRFPPSSPADLAWSLRNPRSLAPIGLFLAAVFVAIDAADHASGGNVLAIFGDGEVELWLHGLFIAAIAALSVLQLVRPRLLRSRVGSGIIAIGAVGLLADAAYHAATGDVGALVGHTPAEAIAHLATYYGIALLAVSRFVLRPV